MEAIGVLLLSNVSIGTYFLTCQIVESNSDVPVLPVDSLWSVDPAVVLVKLAHSQVAVYDFSGSQTAHIAEGDTAYESVRGIIIEFNGRVKLG